MTPVVDAPRTRVEWPPDATIFFIVCSSLALVMAVPAHALAQAPTSTSPTAPTPTAFDNEVLELRDGSTLRGRVVERRADGSVLFQIMTGEVRAVTAEQLPPANPASLPPSPAALSIQRSAGRAPLVVESNGEPLAVGPPPHELGVTGEGLLPQPIDALCFTPCTLWVRPGPVMFGTGGPGRALFSPSVTVTATGLRVRVRSVAHTRYPHWVWTAAGVAFGALGAAALVFGAARHFDPALYVGAGLSTLALVPLVVGIVLTVTQRVGIETEGPLDPSSMPTARGASIRFATAGVSPIANGLSLSAAFTF